jgi:hypothetical protein
MEGASSPFAPPSTLVRSDSRNNSKLLLQKDRLIESLRLELAEAQLKIAESEHLGGGRLQEVERLLLEARMTNARLMEDNESYQLLLQERTLNGDFGKAEYLQSSPARADALSALEGRTPAPASSLADELASAGDVDEAAFRRLETELKAATEQNKALTVYINKIIGRLLEHQDFETILDQSSDLKPDVPSKELPPPPPPKDTAAQPSILQRAKSVALGAGRVRPRPMSQMPAPHSALTDPETAPSIPIANLGRSASVRKARPSSEQFSTGAFSVVNAMYKGNNGIASPPLHGPQTPRHSTSFFAPRRDEGNPNAAARAPSGSFAPLPSAGTFPGGRLSGMSETGSSTSDGDVSTPPQSSGSGGPTSSPGRASLAPSTTSASDTHSVSASSSGAGIQRQSTFAGNKPRPLRLVQEQTEADRQATQNKRASWMGWMGSAIAGVGAKKGDEAGDGGGGGVQQTPTPTIRE